MPSQPRVVASDMDGTLLDVHHQLTPYTMETLHMLSKKGVVLVLATGRHFFSVKKVQTQLLQYYADHQEADAPSTSCNFFLASSNGARVHDPKGNLLCEDNLDEEIVRVLYERFGLPHTKKVYAGPPGAVESPVTPGQVNDDGDCLVERVSTSAYTTDEWFLTSSFLPIEEMERKFMVRPYVVPFERHNPANAGKSVFSSFPTSGVGKVCFRSGDRPLLEQFEREMLELFGDRVAICFSSNYCLDVMTAGTSKATAIQKVCDYLNREQGLTGDNKYRLADVVSFGDSMNDCDMLRQSGRGFVMSNGQERLKEALPNAEVIGHHNDDSVAKKLRKVFNIA